MNLSTASMNPLTKRMLHTLIAWLAVVSLRAEPNYVPASVSYTTQGFVRVTIALPAYSVGVIQRASSPVAHDNDWHAIGEQIPANVNATRPSRVFLPQAGFYRAFSYAIGPSEIRMRPRAPRPPLPVEFY